MVALEANALAYSLALSCRLFCCNLRALGMSLRLRTLPPGPPVTDLDPSFSAPGERKRDRSLTVEYSAAGSSLTEDAEILFGFLYNIIPPHPDSDH
eukprot:13278978-Heterocapsa_arctica.AAC.1